MKALKDLEELSKDFDRVEIWPLQKDFRNYLVVFEFWKKGRLIQKIEKVLMLKPKTDVSLRSVVVLSDPEWFIYESRGRLFLSRGLFSKEALEETFLNSKIARK